MKINRDDLVGKRIVRIEYTTGYLREDGELHTAIDEIELDDGSIYRLVSERAYDDDFFHDWCVIERIKP